MSQLAFEWPRHVTYTADDFIVSASNNEAVMFIENWPKNHDSASLISGPAASGKTHLAHLWNRRMHAVCIDPLILGQLPSEALWQGSRYGVLENIETIRNEAALFHLLRHSETVQCHLLMTSQYTACELPFKLPDLRSRLLALTGARIYPPDDALLCAYLTKLCADRQWHIPAHVINYLAVRTERSFAAVQILMTKLEKLLLTTNTELTIPRIKPMVE